MQNILKASVAKNIQPKFLSRIYKFKRQWFIRGCINIGPCCTKINAIKIFSSTTISYVVYGPTGTSVEQGRAYLYEED